jgi:hypothetical protein
MPRQLLQGLLYGVTRTEPVGLAAVLIVVLGTALVARRSHRVSGESGERAARAAVD